MVETLGPLAAHFSDIENMGKEIAWDWVSEMAQEVPDSDISVIAFSCKDLSALSMDSDLKAAYVMAVLQRFMENPDAPLMEPLEGSTLPTLIGGLKYVAKHRPLIVVMENVIKVKELLPIIQKFLEELGYCFGHKEINSNQLGIPQNRPRIYFGGVHRRALIEQPQVPPAFGERFDKLIGRIQAQCQQQPMRPIYEFILPDGSSYYDAAALTMNRGLFDPEVAKDEKWPNLHENAFADQGMHRPNPYEMKTFISEIPDAMMKKWFAARPHREQECAYFYSMSNEFKGEELLADLSQCITRQVVKVGQCGCLTGTAVPWLVHGRRGMSGREMLAMQGISLRAAIDGYTDELLSDLAGNAFSGACIMSAVVGFIGAM